MQLKFHLTCILFAPACVMPYLILMFLKRETWSRRRGFTLVEVLVVISIIAVLGTIVAISSKSALIASKQATSTTNLRNIGIAMQMFADDHGGKLPETTHTAGLGRAWIYALQGYMGNFDEMRICPADPKAAARRESKGSSYILNSYLFVPRMGPFGDVIGPQLNRISAIPDPARTILAFICSDRTGTGPGNDHTHSNLWTSWSAVCNDIAPDRFGGGSRERTKGRSVYLHVDGSIEAMSATFVKQQIQSGNNIAKPPGVEDLP